MPARNKKHPIISCVHIEPVIPDTFGLRSFHLILSSSNERNVSSSTGKNRNNSANFLALQKPQHTIVYGGKATASRKIHRSKRMK